MELPIEHLTYDRFYVSSQLIGVKPPGSKQGFILLN
jgi:hypothetical protein